jgi:hypothetical protein
MKRTTGGMDCTSPIHVSCPQDMDLWLAMRDATVWGDMSPTAMRMGDTGTSNAAVVTGYGYIFKLRKLTSAPATCVPRTAGGRTQADLTRAQQLCPASAFKLCNFNSDMSACSNRTACESLRTASGQQLCNFTAATSDPEGAFDAQTDDFIHATGNSTYRCGTRTLITVMGSSFYVCPRLGLLNAGWRHQQDLWTLTGDPRQGAFMRDGEDGHSVLVWVR